MLTWLTHCPVMRQAAMARHSVGVQDVTLEEKECSTRKPI
jgi:hypothetical protein